MTISMISTRLLAANIINEVCEGRSLSECLEPALATLQDPRDRAFVQALCYGGCRFYTRLDAVLAHLLDKPMKVKDSDVHAVLLVGLYQLMEMRIPEHAAVAETVNAVAKLKKPWAKGFVNGVLRQFLRQKEEITQRLIGDEEAEFAHPDWWIDAIQQDWPEDYQAILTANNAHPPFIIRVNLQHISRDAYLAQLHDAGLEAVPVLETSAGIRLLEAVNVSALPGFEAGDVSVQDGAAQYAALLMELKPGLRVLDACAAPGGKLMHLLECEPDLEVVAVEKESSRMKLIAENLKRGQLTEKVTCITQDIFEFSSTGKEALFDRILLDAPCSASGVIRRHPDIKLLRQPSDIPVLAEIQYAMLAALWSLLKPGGVLLYATCSVFSAENEKTIQLFLSHHPDAKEKEITEALGLPRAHGRQILPGQHEMDGFYYAKLVKDDLINK